MITQWLASQVRPEDPNTRFTIRDVVESGQLTGEVEKWIAARVREERFHPALTEDLISLLGWEKAKDELKAGMPSLPLVRKGVFGEVLASECITQFENYVVPVRKLRSMISSGQSLPGTDVLAFFLDDAEQVARACYIEAKLRAFRDLPAAVKAEEQLRSDMDLRFPQVLLFVANSMYEANHPLQEAVREYLHKRQASAEIDEFRIHLTWETAEWSEQVLERLNEAEELLKPLTLCALLVADLTALVQRVYDSLGISIDPDDD